MKNFNGRRVMIVLVALTICAWLSWSRDQHPCGGSCLPFPEVFAEPRSATH